MTWKDDEACDEQTLNGLSAIIVNKNYCSLLNQG